MFRSGDIWRHKNCLDMDIEIQKVQYRGPIYWSIVVKYWSRRMQVYLHEDKETVKIKKSEWPKWKLVFPVNNGYEE